MRTWMRRTAPLCLLGLAMAVPACDSEDDDHGDEHGESEVISRVTLTFTPDGGGDAVVASFDDPDGDGGMSGSSDAITLAAGTSYTMTVEFVNALEDPAEDITEEIREEAEEHMVLVYGDAVTGPAGVGSNVLVSHAYADVESDYGMNAVGDDLPVGLANTMTATNAGTAEFRVMLRHLPELNGEAQKTGDLVDTFASGGATAGEVDVAVDFELTVQ